MSGCDGEPDCPCPECRPPKGIPGLCPDCKRPLFLSADSKRMLCPGETCGYRRRAYYHERSRTCR